METLQLKLNVLSLGHLSPAVVSPTSLRKVFNEIRGHLPPTLRLPKSPRTSLWYYYKTLTCSTVFDENKIIVIINIPLVDADGQYDLYQIFNVPLPFNDTQNTNSESVVALYDLEATHIAVAPAWNRFVVLRPDEVAQCNSPGNNICELRSPIFHANINKFCLIALFLKNKEKIHQNCHKIVKLSYLLPSAIYLTNGNWIIKHRFHFT